MAASILTEGEITLLDCPALSDIGYMADILRTLGCGVLESERRMAIDPGGLCRYEMPDALAKKIRSSIFMLGPILARFRKATVTYPGGCEIGMRPIDLHLYGLRQLGVDVRDEGGLIHCDGRAMRAGTVHFDYRAWRTEKVMMAAPAKGRTTLHNAAREPEIVDLQRFLNRDGRAWSPARAQDIAVEGVKALHGATYRPMPDRIVAARCWRRAARAARCSCQRAPPAICSLFNKLREMGCRLEDAGDRRMTAPTPERFFPAPNAAPRAFSDRYAGANARAAKRRRELHRRGERFENRFIRMRRFERMGANVIVNGRDHQAWRRSTRARDSADLRGGRP